MDHEMIGWSSDSLRNYRSTQNHNSVTKAEAAPLFPICNIASTKLRANMRAVSQTLERNRGRDR
jgi:hypothetical protein